MYRLAGARGAYSGAVSVYTSAAGTGINGARAAGQTERASCTLCRRPLQENTLAAESLSVRPQSTHTASVLQKFSKKKMKYKKQKKYVELIEINDKLTKQTKASVNNLRAVHLSKLASSPVSLGQLHQLTTNNKPPKPPPGEEIDFELLKTVENEIMKKYQMEINLQDDDCALIFTSQKITNDSKFMTKEYLNAVKESYNSFRRMTIRDQRLKDLNFAINEGLNQEFELDAVLFEKRQESREPTDGERQLEAARTRGVHHRFRQFLTEHRQTHDNELLDRLTHMQCRGVSMPMEDMYEESLQEELVEDYEVESDVKDLDLTLDEASAVPTPNVKALNINKSKQKINSERKAKKRKQMQSKEKSMKHKSPELERKEKEESLNKLLAAHLHLHCALGMVQQAHHIMLHYRCRAKRNSERPKVNDPRIFNILLQGYADKGDYSRVCELLSYMTEDNIERNIHTYSAVFQCVERSSQQDKLTILESYRRELEEKGWSLNDLLDKGKFLSEQRKYILSAVRRLEPGFAPRYTPPQLDYVCPLLDKLRLDNITVDKFPKGSEVEELLSVEELKRRGELQLQNEISGYIELDNIEISGEPTAAILVYRKKLEAAEKEWRECIRDAYVRNLSTLKSQSNASHSAITLYPYLTVIDVDEMVDLMMSEVRRLADGSESYSPSVKALQMELGLHIYNRFKIMQYRKNGVLDKIRKLYGAYCEWYASGGGRLDPRLNSRQAWQTLMHNNRDGACLDQEEYTWPSTVCMNVGKFLYNIIVNDVKIDVNMFNTNTTKLKKLPAIYKVHRPCGRLYRVEAKPHPLLSRLCRGAATPKLRMRTTLVPLSCPPVPWTRAGRDVHGACLLTPPTIIRMLPNTVAQWKRLEAADPSTIYPSLDSLNKLGEVPWIVNTRILDLQMQVFRSGGSKKMDISQPPSALDVTEFTAADTKAGAFKRRLAISRAKAEMYSLWCDMLYKLSLANHYREEMFWLPHNMDFRGRVYAVPPHLSQLGADTSRALLKFARAEPLGPGGLRWLKIHLVNLTGTMKKATLDERLEYADSIMDKILDSADRPLEGSRWWASSEEPWQTLACCMEIADAVRSPDPAAYECSFPVHQDGSCNGLQHYAALGRDSTGAASVNLAPLSKPQDVYTAVANLVEATRARDAEKGLQQAITLEGYVRRKVIKQTVMTTVYGVTRFGARLQIAKQLKDIDKFPKEHIWSCSSYLTTKTFESLREMFTSTKLIQDWFTDCAKLISGVCGESVEWVTPMGLPVVQPYHRRLKFMPTSAAVGTLSEHSHLDQYQRPCMTKQKNAFPPNFIHSLDSSHMMLTSLYCRANNVQFVSVHDCFWTHASTVDAMNTICREQFVALHSQPILEDLSRYMMQRYSYSDSELPESDNKSVQAESKRRVNIVLQRVPPTGDFDLENVLKSVYFFS